MSRLEYLKIKAKLLQKSKKKSGKQIKLKEAYEIIAKSAGYGSWREMKSQVEKFASLRPSNSMPYWNNWYSSYEEAKQHLKQPSYYLLPFENQFFICEIDYIEELGISRNDPDLSLVGHDWVSPQNTEALERLLKKVKAKQTSGGQK